MNIYYLSSNDALVALSRNFSIEVTIHSSDGVVTTVFEWLFDDCIYNFDFIVFPAQGILIGVSTFRGFKFGWLEQKTWRLVHENFCPYAAIADAADTQDQVAVVLAGLNRGVVKFVPNYQRALITVNAKLYLTNVIDSFGMLVHAFEVLCNQTSEYGKPMSILDGRTEHITYDILPFNAREDRVTFVLLNRSKF